MDTLHIKGLVVHAFHGVFDSEKELGQRFILNVKLVYDMTKAAVHHDLTASVHYGELCQQLTEWFTETKYDLIETAAYQLVAQTFAQYPIVEAIELEVQKPWAPIHLPLDTCSVCLTRKKVRAFIGLGSNMGDKQKLLGQAVERMQENGLHIVQQSTLRQTAPWGGVEQEDFLNQVIEIETWQTAPALLDILQQIEKDLGRERLVKWGPRTIDLDILLYDDAIIETDCLTVPHPYMNERAFVLEPLAEIAPHKLHPVYRKSIRQLLQELSVPAS